MGRKEREGEILPTGVWWGNVASTSIIFLLSAVFPQDYWRSFVLCIQKRGPKVKDPNCEVACIHAKVLTLD